MTILEVLEHKEAINAGNGPRVRLRNSKLVGQIKSYRWIGLGKERHARGVPPFYVEVVFDNGQRWSVKPKGLAMVS